MLFSSLCTQADYSLLFALKDKPLLVDESTIFLKILHPFLIFTKTLSTAPPLATTVPPR